MQRLVVDVEDRYTNLAIDLLSNLKQNIVKNVTIQNGVSQELEQNKNVSKLDTFRKLRDKSNNKTTLTMAMAINTNVLLYAFVSNKLNEDKNDINNNLEFQYKSKNDRNTK